MRIVIVGGGLVGETLAEKLSHDGHDISLVEQSASSELFTLMKREDEKYITEHAYDHPRFVEDLVREVTGRIEDLGIFPWFSVEAENFESIHNHSAYASITSA